MLCHRDWDVLLKSRVREIRKHGSVRGIKQLISCKGCLLDKDKGQCAEKSLSYPVGDLKERNGAT